ncbi:hypothetical protein UFOVP965_93 [uncultured Caudovirales phage]|uniref:Uncharacterized protein n=1 Tax=uncultured Caudovirales phage TaxID=2100421 RepID=A0A6J5QBQ0_9CAUD|nr:hypothetical protein UFOVP965_93 [uncultured Caudovirales phage]CAB4179867.1 hypothetical protein UFOVP1035_89 [uncultured Caudovirales phage]CAB4188673.1 hypothetical protein UFOVP1181_48 [uncultured Caudovirales phage]
MSKHLYIVGYDTLKERWSCEPEHDERLITDKTIRLNGEWYSPSEVTEYTNEKDCTIGERLEDIIRVGNALPYLSLIESNN